MVSDILILSEIEKNKIATINIAKIKIKIKIKIKMVSPLHIHLMIIIISVGKKMMHFSINKIDSNNF